MFQVTVGGADHPQIDLALLHSTNPADAAVFQQLEQLGLQHQVHFADLVKEQGAAIGSLHQSHPALLGIGERALLVAKQFGLKQVGRDRSAIELDERPFTARTIKMQGAGHQLLAGTGLAFDQHRWQVVTGHAPLGIEHLAQGVLEGEHHRRVADQCLQPGLLRLALLVERQRAFHTLGSQGLVQGQFELGQNHRLGQVMKGALLHRLHGIFYIAVAGHHDHFQAWRLGHQGTQQVVPAHAWQRVVGQHRVRLRPLDLLQRQLCAVAHDDFVALEAEVSANVVGKDFIILDDQDAVLHVPLPLQY